MSSRPVDFDISKLRIYFLTNAIFISGILKETLLSTFESSNFFYIFTSKGAKSKSLSETSQNVKKVFTY